MIQGLYVSAMGSAVQVLRLDVLANNLANVNTAGFKKELALFMHRGLPQYPTGRHPVSMEPVAGGVLLARTPALFNEGPLEATHDPLHAAIQGEGFFAVSDASGKVSLTRAGAFQRGLDGSLLTADARYRVLGPGLVPVTVPPEAVSVELRSDGTVLADGVETGIIGRFRASDTTRLTPIGDARFGMAPGDVPQASDAPLAVGMLEGSNVELVREMVASIDASRQFEMNMRLMKVQDDLLGRTVREVARIG